MYKNNDLFPLIKKINFICIAKIVFKLTNQVMKKFLLSIGIVMLTLGVASCRKDAVGSILNDGSGSSSGGSSTTTVSTTLTATSEVTVTFNGTSAATVTGADDFNWTYSVDKGYVVLGNESTTVSGLVVNVTGSTTAGALTIYNASDFTLKLNGATVTSGKGSPMNIQNDAATKVVLTGTNTLTDNSSYSDTSAKGVFHSEGDLSFSGNGSLTAKGSYKHGIISEGDLSISSGTFTVSTSAAGSKCLKADGDINISGGTITVSNTGSSTWDSDDNEMTSAACIKADETVYITGGTITCTASGAGGKGVRALDFLMEDGDLSVKTTGSYYSYNNEYSSPKGIKGGDKDTSTGSVVIKGGKVYVLTTGGNSSTSTVDVRSLLSYEALTKAGGFGGGGGGNPGGGHGGNQPGGGGGGGGTDESGAEGIESKTYVTISGGYVAVQADDDAINAASKITISDGFVYAYGVNNDGIDSNGSSSGAITISGGVVMAHSTSSPEEGIDCDNMQYVLFQGGTIFSTGGAMGGNSGGSPKLSNVAGTYLSNTSVSQGYFTVTDASGNVIMSCYVPRAMSQNYSYVISDKMSSGTTYYYTNGGSAPTSSTTSWGSYYYYGGSTTKGSSSFSAKSSL